MKQPSVSEIRFHILYLAGNTEEDNKKTGQELTQQIAELDRLLLDRARGGCGGDLSSGHV